jgi:uncharacterized integral membrane protein
MRFFVWLFRAFVFFALFAFSLNNQQTVTVHWFFGYVWNAPWSSSCWRPSRPGRWSACWP